MDEIKNEREGMTFWNYSGRGWGGRWDGGRGGGRGGRFGSSSPHQHHHSQYTRGGMSWVRGGGRGSTGGGRGGREEESSLSSVHKWIRPKEETNIAEAEEASTSPSTTRTGSADGAAQATTIESMETTTTTTTISKSANSLVKRGSYQLVTRENGKNPGAAEEKVSASKALTATNFQESSKKKLQGESENDSCSDHEAEPSHSQSMKRVGRHKLVLKVAGKRESNATESLDEGKNLQVSPRDETDQEREKTNGKASAQQGVSKYHASINNPRLPVKHPGPKKRALPSHFHNRRPAAQRIKLANQDPSLEDGSQDDSETLPDTKPAAQAHEKLSDFAYRESGRVVQQQYQNRKWKAGDNSTSSPTEQRNVEGPRKMGLVRAKHSNAPICPFYAKGIDCTDKFCRKRHDVPKESAVPVCSFFQGNGQCLKEDCKFRHVKTRAIVCPTFALLGYCDNNDCTMKHLRPQQKASSKTKGPIPTTGNRSYVRRS